MLDGVNKAAYLENIAKTVKMEFPDKNKAQKKYGATKNSLHTWKEQTGLYQNG